MSAQQLHAALAHAKHFSQKCQQAGVGLAVLGGGAQAHRQAAIGGPLQGGSFGAGLGTQVQGHGVVG